MQGFREFVEYPYYTEQEVVNLYLNSQVSLQEISKRTSKSIGEIYRILQRNFVEPNRLRTNHKSVLEFFDAGLSIDQIAQLTGYTTRNVRYILSK